MSIQSAYIEKICNLQNKYLPKSPNITNSDIDSTSIITIRESKILLEILLRYITDPTEKLLVENMMNLYDQFTFAIVTKNSYQLTSLCRIGSDLLLKLALALNIKENKDVILNEQFRFLKEKISGILLNDDQKAMIEIIESDFSRFSDSIHAKYGNEVDTFQYLADQLEARQIVSNQIHGSLAHFNKMICVVIFKSAGLTYNRFGTVEKTLLANNLKSKRIQKLKKLIS